MITVNPKRQEWTVSLLAWCVPIIRMTPGLSTWVDKINKCALRVASCYFSSQVLPTHKNIHEIPVVVVTDETSFVADYRLIWWVIPQCNKTVFILPVVVSKKCVFAQCLGFKQILSTSLFRRQSQMKSVWNWLSLLCLPWGGSCSSNGIGVDGEDGDCQCRQTRALLPVSLHNADVRLKGISQ